MLALTSYVPTCMQNVKYLCVCVSVVVQLCGSYLGKQCNDIGCCVGNEEHDPHLFKAPHQHEEAGKEKQSAHFDFLQYMFQVVSVSEHLCGV